MFLTTRNYRLKKRVFNVSQGRLNSVFENIAGLGHRLYFYYYNNIILMACTQSYNK